MSRETDPERPLFEAAVSVLAERGGHGVVPVVGDSMRPTLEPGSEVEVQFSPGRLRRGDLLLFRQADYLVVHRLLGPASKRSGTGLLKTRGDGSAALDPPVPRDRVLGRVTAVRRPDGWRAIHGPGARAYSLLVAVHGLAWVAATLAAGRLEKALSARGIGVSLRDRAVRGDRAVLRAADRLLFDALHRRRVAAESAGRGREGPR